MNAARSPFDLSLDLQEALGLFLFLRASESDLDPILLGALSKIEKGLYESFSIEEMEGIIASHGTGGRSG
jgi:hypothetical protein